MKEGPSSWPFQEAKKINLNGLAEDEPVVFETGFGPSGRPHIGTFAEVARTVMVRNAFHQLHPNRRSELYVFCDDMDGLRKVPLNVPNREMLREHLGKPLCRIPDPFGQEESYAAYMEKELEKFLARFGFELTIKRSVEEYSSGAFNRGLHLILLNYEKIRNIILPTLKEENREKWSPIIPACENCGRIYTTLVTGYDPAADTVSYECAETFGEGENRVQGCGHRGECSVFNGRVKVGWKVDWALRWFTYKVRYEMYGKDLIDSAKLSSKICRLLGHEPPAGMVYEMFLEETGKKISKSVGVGLTVDSWMTYAPIESLLCFLYQNPKKQRRLYFDVIPKSVDDYLAELKRFPSLPEEQKPDSVIWQIKKIGLSAPAYTARINYSLVLNLISAIGAGDRDLLYDYLKKYDPLIEENREVAQALVDRAVRYFQDFIEPTKKYRPPREDEVALFKDLLQKLEACEQEDEEAFQALVFDTAREHGVEPRDFFRAIYEVLLGQERGPRFGTFVKLVGRAKAMEMIREKLQSVGGEDL